MASGAASARPNADHYLVPGRLAELKPSQTVKFWRVAVRVAVAKNGLYTLMMKQPTAWATPHAPNIRDVRVSISTTRVDGGTVRYTSGGDGPVILFLHGWGLGHHAYRPAVRALVEAGYRVVAPALPGFGGTADLPNAERTFAGYASWTCRFADALGLRNVILVGHSFGGGVATQMASTCGHVVRSLVLLNSVGAPWKSSPVVEGQPDNERVHAMAQRPMWSWGLGIPSDALALLANAGRVMPSVLEDLLPNMVRNPLGITRVGRLATSADLSAQLHDLRAKHFPVTVAHSERDAVIPRSSFDCLCRAAGVQGVMVEGNHSWPLTNPTGLVQVIDDACKSAASMAA
jgi:pimeloyl-ACP methyl ester carboxylesterase